MATGRFLRPSPTGQRDPTGSTDFSRGPPHRQAGTPYRRKRACRTKQRVCRNLVSGISTFRWTSRIRPTRISSVLLRHRASEGRSRPRPLHRELPVRRRSCTGIAATCSAWTRPRHALKWTRFGTRRTSERTRGLPAPLLNRTELRRVAGQAFSARQRRADRRASSACVGCGAMGVHPGSR
jgi:hypothetical protein